MYLNHEFSTPLVMDPEKDVGEWHWVVRLAGKNEEEMGTILIKTASRKFFYIMTLGLLGSFVGCVTVIAFYVVFWR